VIRGRDLVLIGAALLLAAACFFAVRAFRGTGAAVRVSVEGETVGEYPLSEDAEIRIPAGDGYNLLVIRDGAARITEADCPRRLCMAHRPVSRAGEVIVCLPHRVTVEVLGGRAGEYDAVTG
jgi:hypothetical protein